MPAVAYRYRIGADDRIAAVDDAWLTFAVENEARLLDRSRVIGEPIWAFISGKETRHLYQLVFDKVRATHRPVALPFRCDAPGLRRFMELRVEPLDDGGIALTGTVQRVEERPEVELLAAARPAGDELVVICSWCRKVRLKDGTWAEVEDAVQALGLFALDVLPGISHGLCAGCAEDVASRL